MDNMQQINENIYRMTIPYKDIFTTVYIIKTDKGAVLFDTATTDEDCDNYIIPFIRKANVDNDDLKYIFISHNHRDHAGGIKRLLEEYPAACIVSKSEALKEMYNGHCFLMPEDGDVILDNLQIISIPGHTKDSCAIYDKKSKIMITGDCMQLYGIYGSGDWGCNISFYEEHKKALDKVKKMDISTIYTAHDYHPMGYTYNGKEEILKAIDYCIEPLEKIKELICEKTELDDAEIRELYNSSFNLPTVNLRVVTAIRNYIENN